MLPRYRAPWAALETALRLSPGRLSARRGMIRNGRHQLPEIAHARHPRACPGVPVRHRGRSAEQSRRGPRCRQHRRRAMRLGACIPISAGSASRRRSMRRMPMSSQATARPIVAATTVRMDGRCTPSARARRTRGAARTLRAAPCRQLRGARPSDACSSAVGTVSIAHTSVPSRGDAMSSGRAPRQSCITRVSGYTTDIVRIPVVPACARYGEQPIVPATRAVRRGES